jgi:hypothetical protein
VRLAALALVALALTGCETSAEKSAKLEREARVLAAHTPVQKGLSIARTSTAVRVVSSSVVHGSEGNAVVITLRNASAHALRDVPIALTAKDARGNIVYTNTTPGLASNLVSVALVPAHAELTWVDDQLPTTGPPVSVLARVGEAPVATGPTPTLSTEAVHLFEDPTNGVGAQGNVVNHSSVTQRNLVVYVLARRGGAVVAAGRAVLPLAAAGAATAFQVFFVGSPQGAQLQATAPPTTLG